jgi:ABC-2 type transport system permease protein
MRLSLQREMAFQANFYINLLHTVLNLFSGLAGVSILFGQVASFQGWTYPQALTLLGVYMLFGALLDINLWPSLNTMGGLDGEVWVGSFDFTLLKPLNTQFLVSFRNWDLWQLVNLALGLAVLGRGLHLLGEQLALVNILVFVLMLCVALIFGYSILLFLESGVFYYLGAPLTWVFSAIMYTGRFPIGIYPEWIRLLLTWVVPVGFMVTIPTQALLGSASPGLLAAGIGLAGLLFVAASAFFRRSLRKYASASS